MESEKGPEHVGGNLPTPNSLVAVDDGTDFNTESSDLQCSLLAADSVAKVEHARSLTVSSHGFETPGPQVHPPGQEHETQPTLEIEFEVYQEDRQQPFRCGCDELKTLATASVRVLRVSYPSFELRKYIREIARCLRIGGVLLLPCASYKISDGLDEQSQHFWSQATKRFSLGPKEVIALRDAGLIVIQTPVDKSPVGEWPVGERPAENSDIICNLFDNGVPLNEHTTGVSLDGVTVVETIVSAEIRTGPPDDKILKKRKKGVDYLKEEQMAFARHMEADLKNDPGRLLYFWPNLWDNEYQQVNILAAVARLLYQESSSETRAAFDQLLKEADPQNDWGWVLEGTRPWDSMKSASSDGEVIAVVTWLLVQCDQGLKSLVPRTTKRYSVEEMDSFLRLRQRQRSEFRALL